MCMASHTASNTKAPLESTSVFLVIFSALPFRCIAKCETNTSSSSIRPSTFLMASSSTGRNPLTISCSSINIPIVDSVLSSGGPQMPEPRSEINRRRTILNHTRRTIIFASWRGTGLNELVLCAHIYGIRPRSMEPSRGSTLMGVRTTHITLSRVDTQRGSVNIMERGLDAVWVLLRMGG
ncbi:hypothetical protein EDD15DRAFT_616693 [Pisolithus albus]|nr:hypothetical protein EDD15DRAFT_616693 [Pisolithus albus]